jgi:L-lactate dehydrogenase complex protein LldF
MEEKHQINLVKKSAMIVAGKVLSNPTLYRMAGDTMEASLKVLPRFAIYNQLNAWGRHRDIPPQEGVYCGAERTLRGSRDRASA